VAESEFYYLLAKVACGAFADIGFVTARKRRDFCGLQGHIQ